MRILLIEDNPGDARLVREMLSESSNDFTVDVAERLGRGMELLRDNKVDVALLDMNLPDSRGIETLTAILSIFPRQAVVVMTSTVDEALALQALKMGAQDYIVKGTEGGELLRRAIVYAFERKTLELRMSERNDELIAANASLRRSRLAALNTTEDAVSARKLTEQANEKLRGEIADRKRAEQALQQSEERLRNLFDTMAEGFCVIEMIFDARGKPADFRFLEVNPAFERQTGLHDAKGKNMRQLAPALEAYWFDSYGKVAETGEPARFDNEARALNRWFDVSAYRVDAPGERHVAVVFNDITERKQAEKRIRHLASFPQLSPTIIMELDLAGNIVYANPYSVHAAKEAGLELPGDLLPGDMAGVFNELVSHPGSTASREVELGDNVFQLGIFQPRGIEGYRVHGVDITERKRAEEMLAKTRDYLEKLINYANAPIIVWSPDSRITRFNGAFEELAGYMADEVKGKKLEFLFPEESKEASLKEIQRTLSGGHWETIEIPILRKDGSTRIALWNSANIYDKDGRTVISTIAQGQDITERKRAELALRKARERNTQQEKLAAIGRLAGGVAHELRNPLAAMKNAAYYLGMAVDRSDPSVAETLAVLNREIARSDSIITSLLGLARPARPSRTEIDVSAVLESTLGTLRLPPGVTLETRLDEALPPVSADAGQLSIVFGNILRNACEAMPGGGALTVASAVDGGRVVVTIRDSGTGMPPEVVSHLFEPLFSTKTGGTGLGLSVARMLLEGHGGTMDVNTEPGKGTEFTIRLPMKAGARPVPGGEP